MIRYALTCSGDKSLRHVDRDLLHSELERGQVPGMPDDDDHFAVYDDRLPQPELPDRGGHIGDSGLIFPWVTGIRDRPWTGALRRLSWGLQAKRNQYFWRVCNQGPGSRGTRGKKAPEVPMNSGVLLYRLLHHARHDWALHLVDRLCRCVDQVNALRLGRLLAQDEQGHEGCQPAAPLPLIDDLVAKLRFEFDRVRDVLRTLRYRQP